MPKTICDVCVGKWSERMLRTERDAFDLLNPARNPHSKSPLSSQQRDHLFAHFFDPSGSYKCLCVKHLSFYASVGERTVKGLKKDFVNRMPGRLFSLEKPPPQKLKKVAHNKTPAHIVSALVYWCHSNSSYVPNSVNVRRLNAPFTSMKKAFRAFVKVSPIHSMAWSTFRNLRYSHCPHIKVLIIINLIQN